jgi:hypothetical protein
MKTRWIVLAVVGVVVVAGIAWIAQSRLARNVVELAAERGEILLREELRPVRGTTRVLILAFDGVGDTALRDALAAGRMPRLAGFLGDPTGEHVFAHAYAAPDALSILPSTTWAAWSSVFTGQPVAQTGVAGNEWFERETMSFFAPGPTSIDDVGHLTRAYTDGLIGRQIRVPTLFEQADLRAHVSVQAVHRGADVVTLPDLSDVVRIFGALARGVTEEGSVERSSYQEIDQSSVDQLIESVNRHGLPDVQVAYFPGVDLYTHLAEDALAQKQEYLREVIDPEIGRLLALYQQHGALESTYLVIVSDHGHTPVLDDPRNALGEPVGPGDGDGGAAVALLRHTGFRVRPQQLEVDDEHADYQAVVAYQGAMAYVYLADRSTCPQPGQLCDWRRPPRLQEDVLPVARAFHDANRTGAAVPRLRQTLEMVLTRAPVPPGQPTSAFQVFDGTSLVPVAAFLAAEPRPHLLALEERLRDLSEGPFGHHAGDVALITHTGRHRPISDRYYFSYRYHSWHGSPAVHDSHIPFVVARRGMTGEQLRERVHAAVGTQPSQLSITPLVLELLRDP